jgi:alpha-L-fucosidase
MLSTLLLMLTLTHVPATPPEPAAVPIPATGDEYEPTWESLDTHKTPDWFNDAKFGIFIHWGVYSVPAFCDTSTYSEWYQHWYDTNSHGGKVRDFHHRVYGEDFKYQDFASQFKAELFDPAEWASIFRKAGAKYMVITSKHHDGYCLWPSDVASEVRGYPWNSVETGPKRDLLGDLFAECRKEGVRPGLYYSFMEWNSPLYSNDRPEYVDKVMIPQIKDIITRYQPDVFWPDGEWDYPDTEWRSTEILEWIYENSKNPADIVVNDRWGKGLRGQVGDYTTTEYDKLGNSSGKGMRKERPFEECRGIGHSFAFNRAENYEIYSSRTECIQKLIDLVSRGGCLLLDIGPDDDGTIPLIMVDRLLAIGRWLDVNGESIYGTTKGALQKLSWGRTTTKGNHLYLHIYQWPEDDQLTVSGLVTGIENAVLLGDRVEGRQLPIQTSNGGFPVISLAGLHPDENVSVIRLKLEGPPVVDNAFRPNSKGVLKLHASNAEIDGGKLRLETLQSPGLEDEPNLGYWVDTSSTASWTVVTVPGQKYMVDALCAVKSTSTGGHLSIQLGANRSSHSIDQETGGWNQFEWQKFGEITATSNRDQLTLKALEVGPEALINIRQLILTPITQE